jgi:transposase InsO family protein
LEEAVIQEFPQGVRGQGLKLISDNGCQPTSRSFLKVTATLQIEQIFTSFNNPKGNAETGRLEVGTGSVMRSSKWPSRKKFDCKKLFNIMGDYGEVG